VKSEDYKKKYPNHPIKCESYLKRQSERMKGESNPWFNHNGKYSPYSDKFVGNSIKDEVIKKGIENRKKNNNDTTQLGYYTSRGATEQEAKKLLSKRQSTFSKEKCIEKYGEVEGIKIWKERQDKWRIH
jgi:hypothetical protein